MQMLTDRYLSIHDTIALEAMNAGTDQAWIDYHAAMVTNALNIGDQVAARYHFDAAARLAHKP